MTFEDDLRLKIAVAPRGSIERDVLKVVLGEVQLKSSMTKKFTDEQGFTIIKKIIEANRGNLILLDQSDKRHTRFSVENIVLEKLLPSYLTEDQILEHLSGVDVKSAKSDGQAMGMAMKVLKEKNLLVEGETVKAVVNKLRVV